MQADKLSTNDHTDALVTRGGGLDDLLHPKGVYVAVCMGPVESQRERYLQLRADLAEAEAASETARALDLQFELNAIEMEEKWSDTVHNLVTTVGKNDILDKYLKGSSYTQTIRMGLCGTGTKAAGDTQASHSGWNEVGLANAPTYTGNRPSITMGSASSGSSVSPGQAFAITSSGTVAGCFINNGGSATKDDTSGVLFSAGDFTGGSKSVSNGDTVTVTYTLSV